jgi:bacillithiol biosynthesis cysteine-adding enzyme BshC
VDEGGFFVTTGQQPGLFTGPLYSLYKSLTTVRLAQELQSALNRPVAPLFWVASEDHDWAEVDHTFVLDRENELREIRVPPRDEDEPAWPIHRIALGDGIAAVVEAFAELLPDTDFSAAYVDLLRASYRASSTLASGFSSVLESLIGPLGMLFVDADDPVVKEASLPALSREMEEAEAHERLLQERAQELEESGFHVQVPILPGGVNLFLEGPAGRERLYRDDGGYHLRHSEHRLTKESILAQAQRNPGDLSPNVLLRPVVEGTLFPVLSYVGGPGEIAYYAQMSGIFQAHGVGMPVIHPRFSVTLVEPKIRKVISKFEMEIPNLSRPFHELASEFARHEEPKEVRQALGEIRGGLAQGSKKLLKAASEVDPTLKGPVTHAHNAAFAAFEEAERKILQGVKRQNEIALSQLAKAQVHLYPNGMPQERILNVFYYLTRFGEALLPALLDRFRVDLGTEG